MINRFKFFKAGGAMVLTPKFSFDICQPVVAYKGLTAKDAKGAKKLKGVSSEF